MKKFICAASLVGLALASTSVGAAPEQMPDTAATTSSGNGCGVRGSEAESYVIDSGCTFHMVVKLNADGTVMLNYQDKGQLQPGQTVPDTVYTASLVDEYCTVTERATPSGEYKSSAHCIF